MLILDRAKKRSGRYIGITTWLENNVGEQWVDYTFVVTKLPICPPDGIEYVTCIKIDDPLKLTAAILRWG